MHSTWNYILWWYSIERMKHTIIICNGFTSRSSFGISLFVADSIVSFKSELFNSSVIYYVRYKSYVLFLLNIFLPGI